jgi:hypothetical protein
MNAPARVGSMAQMPRPMWSLVCHVIPGQDCRLLPRFGTKMPQHPEPHIRRAIRVLAMLGELHKRGYQLVRVKPFMSPSGAHWRCWIGPVKLFYRNQGAILHLNSADEPHRQQNKHAGSTCAERTISTLPIGSGTRSTGSWLNWSEGMADKLEREVLVCGRHSASSNWGLSRRTNAWPAFTGRPPSSKGISGGL